SSLARRALAIGGDMVNTSERVRFARTAPSLRVRHEARELFAWPTELPGGSTIEGVCAQRACPSGESRVSVAIGDVVVYGAYGVGRVIALEHNCVAGTERECIVIELAAGLRVTLPVEDVAERLRAV